MVVIIFTGKRGDSMVTIKHLQIFREVARVKSMSKAAENLFISQPTISQKISEIENYYHIKLFQRYSKTLGISSEGETFLKYANKILDDLDEIDQVFFTKKENITIRVGATLTVGSTVLPRIVSEIKKEYPNFNIQVYIDNTQLIENLLLENKIDLAIVEGDIHDDTIEKKSIIPDQLVIVCHRNHPLSKYDTINLQQLQNQQFILREKGSGTRTKFEQFMSNHKLQYQAQWQCHSWESIKQALMYDEGLSIISVHLIEKEIIDGTLKVLKIPEWNVNRSFSLCYHHNKEWNENLEIFKNYLDSFAFCPITDYFKKK